MSFIHSPKIVTDGLVLALDAGNTKSYPGTGTTWFDKSGRGNDGILVNGPTFSSANVGSIVFDGVDDYGSITTDLTSRQKWNSQWSNSDELTINTWINANWNGNVTIRDGIIGQRYYFDLGFSFHIHCNPNSLYASLAFNIGSNANFNIMPNIDWSQYTNQLIFVSFRHKGTTRAIRYSVGSNFYNTSLPLVVSVENYMTDETNDVHLIRYSGAGGYREKTIYNLQVYNKWLSDSEVLQNYNATKGRFGL
jgi:hypothetical protein